MRTRPPVRGARHATLVLLVATVAVVVLGATPAGAQAEGPTSAHGSESPSYPESGDVLVRPGDTLYGIARQALGDGSRYVEIFEINRGRAQDDGGALTDPAVLRVGWLLSLPPLDPTQGSGGGGGSGDGEDADDSPGSGIGYTVQRGDTLYGIAREQLGDASRHDEIFAINRGRPQVGGGTLTDPSVLQVGWVFELPRAGSATPSGETTSYTVQRGDTLYGIARDQLGDGSRYLEVFALNRGVPQAVGGALSDPSVLRVGWELQLPAA